MVSFWIEGPRPRRRHTRSNRMVKPPHNEREISCLMILLVTPYGGDYDTNWSGLPSRFHGGGGEWVLNSLPSLGADNPSQNRRKRIISGAHTP